MNFSRIFGAPAATPTSAPVVAAATPTPAEEVPPMGNFKSLWEPIAGSEEVDTTLPAHMFAGVDRTKMHEAAKTVSFTNGIPANALAAIEKGGPEATKALLAILNDVGRRSYADSSFAAAKIVESALSRYDEGLGNRLPSQIKRHQVSDAIRASNPVLDNPATAPIMAALQSQLTVKFPNATVSEIQGMASDYLTQFATAVLPKPKEAEVSPSEDWDKFMSV